MAEQPESIVPFEQRLEDTEVSLKNLERVASTFIGSERLMFNAVRRLLYNQMAIMRHLQPKKKKEKKTDAEDRT